MIALNAGLKSGSILRSNAGLDSGSILRSDLCGDSLVLPEYQVGHTNYAKYFEENSSVFIGVLEVWGCAGGLTGGFGLKLAGLFFWWL